MDERKLYAANTIVHGDVILRNGVVNIVRAAVQSYSALDGEQANTIWLGGDIVLKEDENGELRASGHLPRLAGDPHGASARVARDGTGPGGGAPGPARVADPARGAAGAQARILLPGLSSHCPGPSSYCRPPDVGLRILNRAGDSLNSYP